MKNLLLLLLFVISYTFCYPQVDLEKDTLKLEEAVAYRNNKKPKLKKFIFRNNKFGVHQFHDLYFHYPDCFYLIDSLAEGTIQEIALYFSAMKHNQVYKQDYKSFKVNRTEFEVTLYEVNDDFSIGKKVNTEPIPIVFEEVEKARSKTEKVEIDISPFDFKARRFYIGMRRITETSCKDCYYYSPDFFKTGDDNSYIIYKNEKEEYKKAENKLGFMLKSEVKTLTSYY